jgi:glycine oxidase
MSRVVRVDAAIAGGGIIGLSLGLELLQRGLSVAVLERDRAMRSASFAAAGMLAVHDPQNPSALLPLSLLSRHLYPDYLRRITQLCHVTVPLRTHHALQYIAPGSTGLIAASPAEIAELAPGFDPSGQPYALLDEASLDPRDLCCALPLAFVAAGGRLLEATELLAVESDAAATTLRTSRDSLSAGVFINCCGAWAGSSSLGAAAVSPVKGQLANLHCAPDRLRCVVRAPSVYMLPRGDCRVAIGATVEHVGFDQCVAASAIQQLISAARSLLPEAQIPTPLESWAGLRPGTPDGLPILGRSAAAHCWHATGHYRDGILLAPATARVMAQAILGEPTDVPLDPFSPARF